MVTIAGCSNNACENRLGVIWLHDCSNYLTFPRLVSLTAWHIQMILLFGLVVVQCIHSQWVEINYEGEFYFHAAVLKILVKKWSAYAQYKYWQTPNFQWYRAIFKDPEPSHNTVCPSAQPVWMIFFYFHATLFSWVIASNFHYKQNQLDMVNVQPEPVSCL